MRYSSRQFATAFAEASEFESNQQRMDVADSLRRLHAALSDTTIRAALLTPGLTQEQRISVADMIVKAVYKGEHELIVAMTGLLTQLGSQRSLHLLPSIASLIDIPNRPEITLANFDQEPTVKSLEKLVAVREAEVTVLENQNIIGGLILKRGNDVTDASLSTELQNIRSALVA